MNISLKIAYLASEYPGISHTFIFREIAALRELGIKVITASIRRPAHLDKMTAPEKADAHATFYIKTSSIKHIVTAHLSLLKQSPGRYLSMLGQAVSLSRQDPRSLFKGIAYFAEAGLLVKWMQDNHTDHVHVHFANPAATVAMIATVYGTMTFSMSVHGPDVFYNVDTGLLAEKVIRAKAVRCISHYCTSQLMRLVPHGLWSKFTIVRCGIDKEKFSPRPEPNNTVPEILCVGRLVPAKGQHVLLDACGILKERGINFTLTFVGDGEDRPTLESLSRTLGIADRVTFTGAIGQDEVPGYYDRADIFALASFAEGVPVVLMEAMAKEIPSVSTCITGIPELIEDGKNGVLTAPSDTKDLAHRLQQLINDPALRTTLGRKGRQQVLAHYDLNDNCARMADFFKGFL